MNDRRTSKPLPIDEQPTIETIAKEIVYDGFQTKKHFPQNLVESKLPVPIAKGSRKRVSRKFNVACDRAFHSAYDKAIRLIETQGD